MVAFAPFRLLIETEPEGELLSHGYFLVGAKTSELSFGFGEVLLDDQAVYLQHAGFALRETARADILEHLLLCLLHLTLLEEVEDPVVVGTTILGVELRPSAVLLGDGLLVLGQGDELDLELGELAIGFGDRAKALLQSRSHLDASPQLTRTGIELY